MILLLSHCLNRKNAGVMDPNRKLRIQGAKRGSKIFWHWIWRMSMQHSYRKEWRWICFVKGVSMLKWSVKGDCRLMEVYINSFCISDEGVNIYIGFFIIESCDLAKCQKTQNYIWDVLFFIFASYSTFKQILPFAYIRV